MGVGVCVGATPCAAAVSPSEAIVIQQHETRLTARCTQRDVNVSFVEPTVSLRSEEDNSTDDVNKRPPQPLGTVQLQDLTVGSASRGLPVSLKGDDSDEDNSLHLPR